MIHTPNTLQDLSRLLEGIVSGKLVICDREDVKPNVGGGDQPPREPQVGGGDQPPRDRE